MDLARASSMEGGGPTVAHEPFRGPDEVVWKVNEVEGGGTADAKLGAAQLGEVRPKRARDNGRPDGSRKRYESG